MASQVEDIKWLPRGWPVMIDGFRFAAGGAAQGCRDHILTHAHSDHTTGLRRRRFEHGRIFCTEVTAAAIEHDLKLPSISLAEYLGGGAAEEGEEGRARAPPPPFDPARPVVACPLNARFPLVGGQVHATFGDANHCPGAAIVVFEVPDRPYRRHQGGAAGAGAATATATAAAAEGRPKAAAAASTAAKNGPERPTTAIVVHTGDMRFDAGKMAAPGTPLGKLLARGRRVDALVLDTTYCAPRWRLPPQRESVAALARALGGYASSPPLPPGGGGGGHPPRPPFPPHHRVLVAFSAYHLGKERAYFGAARQLGWRVWLPPAKRRFLEVIGELSGEHAWRLALVAEHPWDAEVHVVGRGALTATAAPAAPRQQEQGGATNGNGNNNNRRRRQSQQQQMPLAEWLQAYLDQTNAALQRHLQKQQQQQQQQQQRQQGHPPPRPFSRAAAVRASGWCHRPSGPGFSLYRPTATTALVSVPYSEHSSFDDLVACVGLLRPRSVVPTVGAETKAQRDALVDSLAPHGIDHRRDRSRLDAYFAAGGVAAGGVARAAAAHERRQQQQRRRRQEGAGGAGGGGWSGDGEEDEEEEEGGGGEADLWEGERWTGAEGGADEPGAAVDVSRVDVEGQRRALEALERERGRERERRERLRRRQQQQQQQQPSVGGGKAPGGNKAPGAKTASGAAERPAAAAATATTAAAAAAATARRGGGIRAFFAPKPPPQKQGGGAGA